MESQHGKGRGLFQRNEQIPSCLVILPQNSHFSQIFLPKFQGQGDPLMSDYPTPQNSHFSWAFLPEFQLQGQGEEEETAKSAWEMRAGFGMKNSWKKTGSSWEFLLQAFQKNSLEWQEFFSH